MVHLVKARATDDALKIAQQLLTHIVRLHGLPRSLLSDRDPRLMSEFWRQLCELLDIKRSNTSGYYPQANGQAERTNQNVKQVLRVALAEHQNWVRALPNVEMSINAALTSSGFTPYFQNLGYEPTLYPDVEHSEMVENTLNESLEAFLLRMEEDREKARCSHLGSRKRHRAS